MFVGLWRAGPIYGNSHMQRLADCSQELGFGVFLWADKASS